MDYKDVLTRAGLTAVQVAIGILILNGPLSIDATVWQTAALAGLGAGLSVVSSAIRAKYNAS